MKISVTAQREPIHLMKNKQKTKTSRSKCKNSIQQSIVSDIQNLADSINVQNSCKGFKQQNDKNCMACFQFSSRQSENLCVTQRRYSECKTNSQVSIAPQEGNKENTSHKPHKILESQNQSKSKQILKQIKFNQQTPKHKERIQNLQSMVKDLTERLREAESSQKRAGEQLEQQKLSESELRTKNEELRSQVVEKDKETLMLTERVETVCQQLDELRKLYEEYRLNEQKLTEVKKDDIQVASESFGVQTEEQFWIESNNEEPIYIKVEKGRCRIDQQETFNIELSVDHGENNSQEQEIRGKSRLSRSEEEEWKYRAHGFMNELEVMKVRCLNLEKKLKSEQSNKLTENKMAEENYNRKLDGLKELINSKNEEIKQKETLLRRFLSGQCRVRLNH